jgi:hypothetical protein
VKTQFTLVTDSCVIFTQDAAGEQAWLQETANQGVVAAQQARNAQDMTDWLALCRAGNATQQNNACTAVGGASGCNPCP